MAHALDFVARIGQLLLRQRIGPAAALGEQTAADQIEQQAAHQTQTAIAGPWLHVRTPSPLVHIDLSALLHHDEFWRSGMPVNIDIVLATAGLLLERWTVSYEASHNQPSSIEAASTAAVMNFTESAAGPSTASLQSITSGDSNHSDETDLILLAQSVYAHARHLPLGAAIADGTVRKSDLTFCIALADGKQLLPSSQPASSSSQSTETTSAAQPPSFDSRAQLAVHKFRAAHCIGGILHLSVVYDGELSGRSWQNQPSEAPTPNPSANSSEPAHSDPPSRRSVTGSPFPSPTIHRRALAVSNLRLGAAAISSNADSMRQSGTTSSRTKQIFINPSSQINQQPIATVATVLQMRAAAAAASVPVTRSSLSRALVRSSSSESSLSIESESHDNDKAAHAIQPHEPQAAMVDNAATHNHSDVVDQDNSHLDDTFSSSSASRRISMPVMRLQAAVAATMPVKPFARSFEHRAGNQPSIITGSPGSGSSFGSLELFGSLVGSYEESILSGRMSTLPSRPIPFLAEIGVIGMGKCRPSLKCPPHLLLAFPAYFYELQDDETPATPYVGSIDVDRRLGVYETPDGRVEYVAFATTATPSAMSASSSATTTSSPMDQISSSSISAHDTLHSPSQLVTSIVSGAIPSSDTGSVSHDAHGRYADPDDDDRDADAPETPADTKTRSSTARRSRHDHDGYRLPSKGQLQIVIKNPSRTAVKVFLVQYDLRDMPSNTKTFLRQKSYAVPPPPSPQKMSPSRRPSPGLRQLSIHSHAASAPPPIMTQSQMQMQPSTAPASPSQHVLERLRYAIHLQFVCTARRHIYLVKSIRVVFSPRAPETDEKLRIVCEGPTNPKYIPIHASTPISAHTSLLMRSPPIASDLAAFNMTSPVRSSPSSGRSSASTVSTAASAPASVGGARSKMDPTMMDQPMRPAVSAGESLLHEPSTIRADGRPPLPRMRQQVEMDIVAPEHRVNDASINKNASSVNSLCGTDMKLLDSDNRSLEPMHIDSDQRPPVNRSEAMLQQKQQAQIRLQAALARPSLAQDVRVDEHQGQQRDQSNTDASTQSALISDASVSTVSWHPTDLAPAVKLSTIRRTQTLSGFKQPQNSSHDNESLSSPLSGSAAIGPMSSDILNSVDPSLRAPNTAVDSNGSPTLLGLKQLAMSASASMVQSAMNGHDRCANDHAVSQLQAPALMLPPPLQDQQQLVSTLHDHSTSHGIMCIPCTRRSDMLDSDCASSFASSNARSLCSNGERRRVEATQHQEHISSTPLQLHPAQTIAGLTEPCTMR